jgi:predicted kinase
LLADDETDQTTPEERRPYLEMGRAFGCEVGAVFFDVPLAICLDRNVRRHRVVPGEALAKMAAKLTPPTAEEGFARVTVLTGGSAGRP